ncbi:DUF72 domain-containing protein [Candidatus Bathyarchaeota archaeon]|nr:DUF72 domain-containing protein [Candidatus Bathyarchaeota archaeon]NIR15653.1 DUF72 domain-containing protein [Desulfobacterales bacterium]NIU80878.1 DUF72 domain-containing protein [Candidatus Bathyarchaeota archaeon]NIV67523.1 DUF72 domain-containing protein [Candidatus Bathyarchaeota archaeon]NIW16041.1 DUF72 domain-containing protein [Candidatus Bathyarchaeota archaeon]
MTKFLIGAGGWAYFQVPSLTSLEAYSQAFNFVEVNSTFYQIPDLRQVESWRRRVPTHFGFAVRCHRDLTHKHKLEPVDPSYRILNRMVAICRSLETSLLHLQTPPTVKLTRSKLDSIHQLFSSFNLKEVRVAWEIRGAQKPLSEKIIKLMKAHNMIHCVDLSRDEEPAFPSDILYTRLFGKGRHNIYQPTDQELKKIHRKAAKDNPETAAVSFHFTKMYKDAARFKIYHQTGEFPRVTKSTGVQSLREVLKEDARFPSNKQNLIDHQGWKLVDLTREERVPALNLLQRLPEKTYNSVAEVITTLKTIT